MTSSEINLVENEIKYPIRQSASNASTQTQQHHIRLLLHQFK